MSGQGIADLEIGELDCCDSNRWDKYVYGHPVGTFFHLSGWQKVFEESLGKPTHYLHAKSEGRIVGILPLVHMKSVFFGNALISLPFLVYGGPVADSGTIADTLIEHARQLADGLGVDNLEFRNREAPARTWPVRNIYATFRKRLDPDPNANLMAIPRKQRAMIRKGIQAGLAAELDREVNRLYDALLECKRNLGTPFFSKRYLRTVKETFGDDVEILTVTGDGRPVCSVMSFRFRDEILPYYGGGGDVARVCRGNDFMYWAVMERACRQGVSIFDYGRSRVDTGAYRFKKHWGFEPEPLPYEYLPVRSTKLPDLNPGNPRFALMIEAWKRLPLPIAGTIGPPIARRLG